MIRVTAALKGAKERPTLCDRSKCFIVAPSDDLFSVVVSERVSDNSVVHRTQRRDKES